MGHMFQLLSVTNKILPKGMASGGWIKIDCIDIPAFPSHFKSQK